MILLGSIVNGIAIIIGGLLGTFSRKILSVKAGETILISLACFTCVMGIGYALKMENSLVVIFSLVFGTIIGEFIDIESKLELLGKKVESKFKKDDNSENKSIAEGFVTASLLFCVGSMAIMGSLESGINNNHEILYTKAILDGVISIIFASSLGIGVVLSFVSVVGYQGLIALLASYVAPYLSSAVIGEMSATGGILLICLALSMMNIKKIRVGNMLPAIFLPIIFVGVFNYFNL